LAARFRYRPVHLASVIFENAKLHNASSQHLSIFNTVFFFYAQQDENAMADAGMFLTVDNNPGCGDALDNGSHEPL